MNTQSLSALASGCPSSRVVSIESPAWKKLACVAKHMAPLCYLDSMSIITETTKGGLRSDLVRNPVFNKVRRCDDASMSFNTTKKDHVTHGRGVQRRT